MAIKLILTHDVDKLGSAGDVVEVKDGYARNYLVPRGLATRWSKGAQKQIDQMAAARRRREIASVDDARAVRDVLQAGFVTVSGKVGSQNRLFGSVSTAQIAQAVKSDLGHTVDHRRIVVARPIKEVGEHTVVVNLHSEVSAKLKVRVIAAAR
ncbi:MULTISPECIES: 50S ribosomal protein L9 [unclassified Schaalia]|uniref:50S ribosomal protein L9 n=1 Tax=unclassified Schaalia TaxID=2691889 RepID=UPI001E4E61A6|nr:MULTISPECIES: 50S ribosomal protein L9 [unclassified Schaalia]MCD4550079.1 50S ribosomal protein L9 [Schaalia sp. lx-260]MCD4557854.1 50S ribosomal protein L9 [Schaalia sp. lx-100]